MTESFKKQLQEIIERAAKDYTSNAYFELEYSTCGTTAKECQAAFKACGNFLMPVLMKAVEQRDDAIWNRFRTKEEYSKVFFATDLADIMDKELLNILKGEGK